MYPAPRVLLSFALASVINSQFIFTRAQLGGNSISSGNNKNQKKAGSSSSTASLAVVGCVLVIGAAIIWWVYRRRRKRREADMESGLEGEKGGKPYQKPPFWPQMNPFSSWRQTSPTQEPTARDKRIWDAQKYTRGVIAKKRRAEEKQKQAAHQRRQGETKEEAERQAAELEVQSVIAEQLEREERKFRKQIEREAAEQMRLEQEELADWEAAKMEEGAERKARKERAEEEAATKLLKKEKKKLERIEAAAWEAALLEDKQREAEKAVRKQSEISRQIERETAKLQQIEREQKIAQANAEAERVEQEVANILTEQKRTDKQQAEIKAGERQLAEIRAAEHAKLEKASAMQQAKREQEQAETDKRAATLLRIDPFTASNKKWTKAVAEMKDVEKWYADDYDAENPKNQEKAKITKRAWIKLQDKRAELIASMYRQQALYTKLMKPILKSNPSEYLSAEQISEQVVVADAIEEWLGLHEGFPEETKEAQNLLELWNDLEERRFTARQTGIQADSVRIARRREPLAGQGSKIGQKANLNHSANLVAKEKKTSHDRAEGQQPASDKGGRKTHERTIEAEGKGLKAATNETAPDTPKWFTPERLAADKRRQEATRQKDKKLLEDARLKRERAEKTGQEEVEKKGRAKEEAELREGEAAVRLKEINAALKQKQEAERVAREKEEYVKEQNAIPQAMKRQRAAEEQRRIKKSKADLLKRQQEWAEGQEEREKAQAEVIQPDSPLMNTRRQVANPRRTTKAAGVAMDADGDDFLTRMTKAGNQRAAEHYKNEAGVQARKKPRNGQEQRAVEATKAERADVLQRAKKTCGGRGPLPKPPIWEEKLKQIEMGDPKASDPKAPKDPAKAYKYYFNQHLADHYAYIEQESRHDTQDEIYRLLHKVLRDPSLLNKNMDNINMTLRQFLDEREKNGFKVQLPDRVEELE